MTAGIASPEKEGKFAPEHSKKSQRTIYYISQLGTKKPLLFRIAVFEISLLLSFLFYRRNDIQSTCKRHAVLFLPIFYIQKTILNEWMGILL